MMEKNVKVYSSRHGWLTVDLHTHDNQVYAVEYKNNEVRLHKKSSATNKLTDISTFPKWLLEAAIIEWPG